jgi:hypothetical protein
MNTQVDGMACPCVHGVCRCASGAVTTRFRVHS